MYTEIRVRVYIVECVYDKCAMGIRMRIYCQNVYCLFLSLLRVSKISLIPDMILCAFITIIEDVILKIGK